MMYSLIGFGIGFATGVTVCWLWKQRTINALTGLLSQGIAEGEKIVDRARKAGGL